MDAEKVIVELIAKVDGFDGKMKQSASSFETEMTKIERAAGRAETATARSTANQSKATTAVAQSLKRDMVDVSGFLQSSSSPFLIVPKQAPAVSNAMRLVTVAGGALGGVMGGAVAVGTGLAVTALTNLIFKSENAADEVEKLLEKMRDQAAQARNSERANAIWAGSLDGLIERTRKLREETERLLDTEAKRSGRQTRAAAGSLQELQAQRKRIETEITESEKRLAAAQRIVANAGRAGGRSAQGAADTVTRESQNLKQLTTDYSQVEKAIRDAQVAVRNLNVLQARIQAEDLTDPIKAKFRTLREEAERTIKDVGKLATELAKIDAAEEKARAKAPKVPKTPRTKAPSLAPVTPAEVAAALGLGAGQYGGTRTAARNAQVKGARNSDHLVGQAIDIPLSIGGKPFTKEGIRAALAPLGVEVKQLLGPGDKDHDDHFHVGFKKKRLAPDQVAGRAEKDEAAIAREVERAAAERRRNEDAYLAELDQLNGRILQLRGQQGDDIDSQLQLALAQIELEKKAADRAVARQFEDGEIDAAKAVILGLANQQVAAEEQRLAKAQAEIERLQRADELQQRNYDYQVADLEYLDELATGRAQHRDLQLQIVDLVFEQRIKHLENLKAQELLNGEIQKAADIQAQINRAAIEQGQAKGRVEKNNRSPFETAAADATDITDELEQTGLDAINQFSDGIADAITGAKSLEQAFSEMAQSIIRDLIQMIIKMLIFKAIKAAIGGGFAEGGEVPGFASGGRIVGPGTGTSDSVPIMASAGEFIIKKKSVDRVGASRLHYLNQTGRIPGFAAGGQVGAIRPSNASAMAPGSNRPSAATAPIMFDLRGAVVTEDLMRQMNQISARNAAQAGRASYEAGKRELPQRLDRLQRLGS